MAGPSSEVTFHGDLNLEPATESEPEQSSSRTMTLEDVINNLCFSEEVRARAHARGTTPAAAIMNHFLGLSRQSTSSSNNGPTLTLEDFLVQAGIPNRPRAPPPPQQPQPPPQQQQPPVGTPPQPRPQQQQRAPTPPQQPQPPPQQQQPPVGTPPQPRPQQQQRAPTPPQQPQPPPQQQQPPVGPPPQQPQPRPQQQQRAPTPPQQQQPPVGMLYPNRHGVALGIPAYGPRHPLNNPAYWHHPFANPAYRCQAHGLAHRAVAPSASVVSHVGVGPPVSPVSSDGESPIQVDTGSQCGLEAGTVGGQKRESDGSKAKVVERYHIESPKERRQRKMMQHRESAARSRASKQAQLLALALDHKQLEQENQKLKQTVAELLNKLSQQSGSGSASPST